MGPAVEGFRYVEFAARRQPGFRNRVIPVDQVPRYVRRFGAFGCYSTFYLFDRGLLDHLREHRRGGRPSVAGYAGPVRAPFWPLDVDAADLGDALAAARAICSHLLDRWGVPQDAIHPYFSGQKGFHLLVDTRVFGLRGPSRFLPEVLHRLTVRLSREVGPPGGGLDLALRDRVRLLRLPNTRHEATGRFKVAVPLDVLMEASLDALLDRARRPWPLERTDPTGLLPRYPLEPCPGAAAVWEEEAAGGAGRGRTSPGPGALGGRPLLSCPARRRLLETPAPVGQRNNTAIRLASWLREAGWDAPAVEAQLQEWNRRNPEPLDEGEIHHVVTSAFSPPRPYRYGCRDPLIAPLCPLAPGQRARCPHREPGAGQAR